MEFRFPDSEFRSMKARLGSVHVLARYSIDLFNKSTVSIRIIWGPVPGIRVQKYESTTRIRACVCALLNRVVIKIDRIYPDNLGSGTGFRVQKYESIYMSL